MILELEKGFGGLIHVSPQPMRHAVSALEAQFGGTTRPSRIGLHDSNSPR
jgi:hypothetical protein